MATQESSRKLFVRAVIGWLVLVVLGVWLFILFGPRVPQAYRPAVVRFIACGSLVDVAGAQLLVTLISGFMIVSLIQAGLSRHLLPVRRFTVAAVITGTALFALSFGGVLLVRGSFLGVCT